MSSIKRYRLLLEDIENGEYDEGHSDKEIIEALKKCEPFLEYYRKRGDLILLHRSHTEMPLYNKLKPRAKPKDTPKFMHHAIDEYLKENYGEYFRSHAIFLSTEPSPLYGRKKYVILPIGKDFKLLQSPRIHDLLVLTNQVTMTAEFGKKLEKFIRDTIDEDYDIFGKNNTHVLNSLYDKSKSYHEIREFLDEIREDIMKRIKPMLNTYEVNPNYIEETEAMLHCDEFVAIPYDRLQEMGLTRYPQLYRVIK